MLAYKAMYMDLLARQRCDNVTYYSQHRDANFNSENLIFLPNLPGLKQAISILNSSNRLGTDIQKMVMLITCTDADDTIAADSIVCIHILDWFDFLCEN